MNEKIQGWVNLYKPKGPSSFSAIYKVKKKFNINKIGHAGTLDPNAEGILPIAINKTTKLIPFVNTSSKKYLCKNNLVLYSIASKISFPQITAKRSKISGGYETYRALTNALFW